MPRPMPRWRGACASGLSAAAPLRRGGLLLSRGACPATALATSTRSEAGRSAAGRLDVTGGLRRTATADSSGDGSGERRGGDAREAGEAPKRRGGGSSKDLSCNYYEEEPEEGSCEEEAEEERHEREGARKRPRRRAARRRPRKNGGEDCRRQHGKHQRWQPRGRTWQRRPRGRRLQGLLRRRTGLG